MTNIEANAVGTVDWIKRANSIAVPVYQRDYRWSLNSCGRLLDDIRSIADAPQPTSHFLGSVLATGSLESQLTLVDGQQRITTLLLLVAALRDVAAGSDPAAADELDDVLFVDAGLSKVSRLRPHERNAEALGAILQGSGPAPGDGTFAQNYDFFRTNAEADWHQIARGLLRLEHVTITLGAASNPQRIFESLNSTGEALSNQELIHNYVHMGLPYEQQLEVEKDYWIPIEEATEGALSAFWRDFLILTADKQPDLQGEFGTYELFKERYPSLTYSELKVVAPEWLRYAQTYGQILRPSEVEHESIAQNLRRIHTFGSVTYPLVLGVLDDFHCGRVDEGMVVETLEQIQTLVLRRAVVGVGRDISLIGPLCRELRQAGYPLVGLVRRTPEDLRVNLALQYRQLPHAGYVLGRLQKSESIPDLQIEHIYPQNPAPSWTGGGSSWGDLTPEDQSRYRALLQTIGNLTLLEGHLNAGASNRAFEGKRSYYRQSQIEDTRTLANVSIWDAPAIEQRTKSMIERFLSVWSRPSAIPVDDQDDLVRVVDLERRPLKSLIREEFDYVVFENETWDDIHDIKALFARVFHRLWMTNRGRLLELQSGKLIVTEKVPRSQYSNLDEGHFLFLGLFPQWLLHETQKIIEQFGLDDQLRVKLASTEDALPE